MYYLFLDDVRNPRDVKWMVLPPAHWIIVRNYNEFVKVITDKGIPEYITFDHDLADEHYRQSMYNPDGRYTRYYTDGTFKEKTGFHCAQWLVNYCIDNVKKLPECICHSMNPIGRENILALFKNAKEKLDL